MEWWQVDSLSFKGSLWKPPHGASARTRTGQHVENWSELPWLLIPCVGSDVEMLPSQGSWIHSGSQDSFMQANMSANTYTPTPAPGTSFQSQAWGPMRPCSREGGNCLLEIGKLLLSTMGLRYTVHVHFARRQKPEIKTNSNKGIWQTC